MVGSWDGAAKQERAGAITRGKGSKPIREGAAVVLGVDFLRFGPCIPDDVALPGRHDDDAARSIGQRRSIADPHNARAGNDMVDSHGLQRCEGQTPTLPDGADGGGMEMNNESRQELVISGCCHAAIISCSRN